MQPTPRFEELDYRQTPLGELILRRRTLLPLDNLEVYEVILGDAYLMTSLFNEVEKALSRLGLAAASEAFPGEGVLDVVVGGLGLGYTAREALDQSGTKSLIVVDFLEPVIEWHEKGMVPLGAGLTEDPRCRFVHGDFFGKALGDGFDPDESGRKFHAVLLDIDHSPSKLLHEGNAAFYASDGLAKLLDKLHPGGVFALWSDDPPDDGFMAALEQVFEDCAAHVVTFHNPHQDCESASTVYVARKAGGSGAD
ncbi:spermidine synthase [Haloferula helveola]|uniref:Spermidine synthase n=1 Tax=Haloferula helveola TaxID=490095 RepID=A0ABN6H8A3_9BACT|nr:spermidine synthase [Haloferula helveola]